MMCRGVLHYNWLVWEEDRKGELNTDFLNWRGRSSNDIKSFKSSLNIAFAVVGKTSIEFAVLHVYVQNSMCK